MDSGQHVVMVRYLAPAEEARFFVAVERSGATTKARDGAWLRLLFRTGMRIGEFSRLTLGRLRDALRTGWIYVPRAERKGKRSDHAYVVTQPVRAAIVELLALAGNAPDGMPAVTSRKGGPLSVRGYQERMALYARAADLAASPHWARHTRAMQLLRKSRAADPLRLIQGALGHASRNSTAIYTRPSKEEVYAGLMDADGGEARTKARARARFFERAIEDGLREGVF
jgi:integrase/recombinase XerC